MKRLKYFIFFLIAVLIVPVLSAQDSDFLLDERDNNIYLIQKFGNHWWMCQNLKYDVGEGSSCYEDDENNCMLKGRWYTFEAAKKACPQGYRLPSDDDWKALESFVGMEGADLDKRYNRNTGTVGKLLKMDGGHGFDADFAGIRNPKISDSYMETHAYFWTSTELDQENAWSRVMEKTKDGVDRQIITKSVSLSVRCVKDASVESK